MKAQEVADRRKKSILKQAERMFKVLDKDKSGTVDTEEVVAAMKKGGSFARMMRQLPDFKPADVAGSSGSVSVKKFKSFVVGALNQIEKAKEELAFGNIYVQSDAATKIQAVQRGNKVRESPMGPRGL